MKELSIEQKAKRYDEALKVLHKYDGANIMFSQSLKEEMFPELKESKDADEKVRNALIKLVTNHASMDLFIEYDIHLDEALAWLEKQGKQNNVWSEEDEKILKDIITDVKFEGYNNDMQADSYKKINWLKSIKDRYTWKPSDEQIKALNEAIYHVDDSVATQIAMLIGELSKL